MRKLRVGCTNTGAIASKLPRLLEHGIKCDGSPPGLNSTPWRKDLSPTPGSDAENLTTALHWHQPVGPQRCIDQSREQVATYQSLLCVSCPSGLCPGPGERGTAQRKPALLRRWGGPPDSEGCWTLATWPGSFSIDCSISSKMVRS